jgi:hypothetical protein
MHKYTVTLDGILGDNYVQEHRVVSAMSKEDAIKRSQTLCLWPLLDKVFSYTANKAD